MKNLDIPSEATKRYPSRFITESRNQIDANRVDRERFREGAEWAARELGGEA